MAGQRSELDLIPEDAVWESYEHERPELERYTQAVPCKARVINIQNSGKRASLSPRSDGSVAVKMTEYVDPEKRDDDGDTATGSAISPVVERSESSSPPDTIDLIAEKRLRRKIDIRVFPILFVVYLFSFLDRINISNARIQGLTEDLDLYGNRFNVALFAYFVPYIIFEIPSNMIIRKLRPSLYLSSLMFGWGIANMCMGFVKTYAQLVALRVLLGIFEAGVLPGIVYLTSMYFKRHDFQLRYGLFSSSVIIAGAIGGLLAYEITNLDGLCGIRAWRWIFIIEGAATAFVSIIAAFLIVDWPAQCCFLNAEEKHLLNRMLMEDGVKEARMDTLNKQAWKLILRDYKIWLASLLTMGTSFAGYSLVFFMPTILVEFGWEAREAQVHSIPVYGVALLALGLVSWLSDRSRHRCGYILFCCLSAVAGFCLLLSQDHFSRTIKYTALFLAAIGGYAGTPMAIVWLANNLSGHWKRALGAGIQISLNNVVGLVAANVFVSGEAPRYTTGYITALAFVVVGGVAATAMFFAMRHENRRRDDGDRNYRLCRPNEEVRNMGDDHPAFRFAL